MIDEQAKTTIDEFLNSTVYPNILDRQNVLGVIVYGSATTGYFDKNSDIDLLILLNYSDHCVRGVKRINGTKIEYFIKPIERFLTEGVEFTNTNCPSHIALNQNAEILYGQKDFVKNILNADNEFYNQRHKRPNVDFSKKLVQIDNRIASLKNIYKRNGVEFNMVYYNILEMIRDIHSSHSGEAAIPFVKAYRVYTDPEYYDKYVGKKAANNKPSKTFIKFYTACVEQSDSRETMLKNLTALFNYEKEFYKINPNDYELTF